jgi:hypothetical protein
MGRLAARIARLETLVPTPTYLRLWLGILHEACTVAGLDARTSERLMAAIRAHHAALTILPLVTPEELGRWADCLVDGLLACVEQQVPPAWQEAYRRAASDLCAAEAARW